jgi:hypothetical protein
MKNILMFPALMKQNFKRLCLIMMSRPFAECFIPESPCILLPIRKDRDAICFHSWAAVSLARLGALGKVLPIAKSDFQQVTRNEWAKPFQVQEQLKFNYHGK